MNTRTNHLAASDLLVDDTELETHVITPIPRIVDMFARRLQVPERMTSRLQTSSTRR